MEDRMVIFTIRRVVFLSVFFSSAFLFSYFAFAYSPYYTHPDLTEEIVKLWNLKNNNQSLEISQDEIRLMRQGAIDEDKPARWINHFYDPIHKTGWSGKHFGDKTQEEGLYEGESMTPKPAIASIDWVINQEYQAAYGRQFGNQTWQKAIKLYIDGDKKSAFIALGHILHLIEDASVPDHTRDDTHADLAGDPGSPYEKYSKEYTNFNKLNIADNLKDKELLNFLTIQSAFEYLANYSNNNFFSEDTISNEEFDLPNIENLEKKIENIGGDKFIFLYNNKTQIYLAIFNKNQNKYSIINKSLILPSYFTHLSQEAVLTGASVLDLFFQEVEKYKQNPESLPDIIPDSEEAISINKAARLAAVNIVDAGDRVITNTKIYTNIVSRFASGVTTTIANVSKNVITSTQDIFSQPQQINPMSAVANIGQIAQNNNPEIAALPLVARNPSERIVRADDREDGGLPGGDDIVVEIATPSARNDREGNPRNDNEIVKEMTQEEINALVLEVKIKYGLLEGAQAIITIQNQPIAPLAPAFALATGVPDTNTEQTQDNQSQGETPSTDTGKPTITEYLTSPPAPIITTNNGQDYFIKKFAAQYPERKISLALEGTKSQDASEILINNSADSVNYPTETSWKKDFILSEGDNIFEARAKDIAGSISELTTIKITLQFSDTKFYLTNYDVRKSDFTLNWGDANGVIKEWELQYKLAPNFDWLRVDIASTDTSTNFTAKYDDLTYYFRLRGQDENGEYIDWLTLEAEISTKPVVINEIAWRGTEASYNDEWIELANKTNKEIDLNGWILKTHYGEINKTLTGKIVANGFYLLERTADTTISNITADQIYTGALRDAQNQYDRGDSIYLYDKDNNIVDQTRTALSGLGQVKRSSSERVSIWSNGNYLNNWLPYSGSGNQEAQDADGNPVYGTPRAKNSQADKYFALNSGVFEAVLSISKDTIFLKNRSPYMANGSVEATNVEVLIEPGASLEFNNFGMLRIHDGGKLIAKGTENEKIIIKSSTSDRAVLYFSGAKGELENLELSGGKVVAHNSTIKIANSAIKNANGLLTLQNSEFDISDSEFSGDNGYNFAGNPYYGEAILIKQSHGKIQNNVIKNNQAHGIYIDSLSGALDILGNNFSGNFVSIATNGFIDLNLKDNIIGGNNMLMIYNPTVKAGEEATISSQMPYFLYPQTKSVALYQIINPEIEKDGILKIEPGAIIEFDDEGFLKIYGELEAMGTLEKPIVLRQQGDGASYEDMVSNIVGTLTSDELNESDYIQFYDGAEVVLENVIIRRKFVDQYRNVSYRSWLVNEPEEPEVSGEPEDEPGESGGSENQETQNPPSDSIESLEIVL